MTEGCPIETFADRLVNSPLFKSALTSFRSLYSRVKDHNSLCHLGLSITEDALLKVYVVLEPLTKQYTSSMDAKLCHWLTTMEEEYPKMIVSLDQTFVRSQDYCLFYVNRATDAICHFSVSRAFLGLVDWILAWVYLVSKLQARKAISLRKELRRIQRLRQAKTLKSFASKRRIVSPKKRVQTMTKWYHWLQGGDTTVTLKMVKSVDALPTKVDKASGQTPEEKKRKHDELKSESEVSLSDILDDCLSDDGSEYKPPPEEDISSTDSLEYKETSDVESDSDEVEEAVDVIAEDRLDAEDDDQEFCSPMPEADRSLNSTCILPDSQEPLEDEI